MTTRQAKRLLAATTITVVTLWGGLGANAATAAPTDPVNIADPSLKQCAQTSLLSQSNKEKNVTPAYTNATQAPTEEQLAQLQKLNCDRKSISNLDGLQYATGLKDLRLRSNQINDIAPLAGLTNLNHLTLQNNPLSNITPLATLVNLQELDLRITQVSDLDVLKKLPELNTLDVTESPVSSFKPLENLTKLKTLLAASTNTSDVSPLANLINLTRLALSSNKITDVSPLANLTQLEELTILNNEISDISQLSNLTNLKTFYMQYNKVEDISAVSGMNALERFDASANQVSNISALAGKPQLRTLYLNTNQISDVTPLSNLSSLQYLMIESNQVADVTPLAGLANILQIRLLSNRVADISPLAGLNNLTLVTLENQRVQSDVGYAGIAEKNPVRGLDGSAIPVTDTAFCSPAAGCDDLLYSTAGTDLTLAWDTSITIGSKTYRFSGELNRDVLDPIAPTLAGTPTSAIQNVQYDFKFDVEGTPTPKISKQSGSLPDGVTLTESGELTGTPTETGTFSFTLKAENRWGVAELDATLVVTTATPPTPPTPPLNAPTLNVTLPEVFPGDQQTITGADFVEGEEITLTMFSDPVPLGTVTVGSDGTFTRTFTVAANTQAGEHRIVAARSSAQPGTKSVEAKFTVLKRTVKEPKTNNTTTVKPVKPALASTGGSGYNVLGWAAAGILVAATAMFLAAKRRSQKNRNDT